MLDNIKKYKMLICIEEKMKYLDNNRRKYIVHMFAHFNYQLKQIDDIKDISVKTYLLDLVDNDYQNKISLMGYHYRDRDLLTHLLCYTKAKIRERKNNK